MAKKINRVRKGYLVTVNDKETLFKDKAEAYKFYNKADDSVKQKKVKSTEDGITVKDILKDAADGVVKDKHRDAAKKLTKKD